MNDNNFIFIMLTLNCGMAFVNLYFSQWVERKMNQLKELSDDVSKEIDYLKRLSQAQK